MAGVAGVEDVSWAGRIRAALGSVWTTRLLTVLVVTLIFVASAAAVSATLQALRMRDTAKTLQDQVYGHQLRAQVQAAAEGRSGGLHNTVRAYALMFRMQKSQRLSQAMRPKPRGVELRLCGQGQRAGLEQKAATHSRDMRWLLVDRARSSDALVEDVRSGRVTHLVISGLPVRVHAAPPPDSAEFEALVNQEPRLHPKDGDLHALAVVHEGGMFDAACTTPPWVYALRMPPQSGEDPTEGWKAMLPELAAREERRSSPVTMAHVWGYATA